MFFSAPALTASGAVGCQHSRCNRSWRTPSVSNTPAVEAWVVIGGRYNNGVRQTVGTTVALCRRHSATLKSLITRGNRSYTERTHRRLVNVPVDLAAANREAIAEAAAQGYDRETEQAEAARRQYIADNSDRMREAHLARTTVSPRTVSVGTRDEYGRVFVSLDYRAITPGQAEAMAAALLEAAATARERTFGGSNV